jgi:hypothetical protein
MANTDSNSQANLRQITTSHSMVPSQAQRSPNPFNFGIHAPSSSQHMPFAAIHTSYSSSLPHHYPHSSSPTPLSNSYSPSPPPKHSTPKKKLVTKATTGFAVTRSKWDADSVNGGKASMDILLQWLLEEGNYSRYRGGDGQKGEKKDTILGEIVALLHDEGLTHRDKSTVGAKITAIEGQFRKAMEWLANTGQGLKDDGDHASIKKYIQKICPYYEELNEIMMDKPSIHAKITSDNLELQTLHHIRSASLNPSTSEQSLKRPRDGGIGEQINMLQSEMLKQSNDIEEKKIEMLERQEEREDKREIREERMQKQRLELEVEKKLREDRIEKRDNDLKKIQKEKLELEVERERIEMRGIYMAQVTATIKQRKELLDMGCTQEEVNILIPYPTALASKPFESIVRNEES